MNISIGSPFEFRGNLFQESIRWFGEFRSHIEALYLRQKAYRNTVFELSQCSDRDLNDLGIARCDIRRLARESYVQQTEAEARDR